MALTFKPSDAAFIAALPPPPPALYALVPEALEATLSQYVGLVGFAGGLETGLLSADDEATYGTALDAAARRATGHGAAPVASPASSSPKPPASIGFTPAAAPNRLLLTPAGTSLAAALAAEAAPPAPAAADDDEDAPEAAVAAPPTRAAPPTMMTKQITEMILNGVISDNALALLAALYRSLPVTVSEWRRRLVGEGITVKPSALQGLPAHILARVTTALNKSWHAGCAVRQAIIRASPAGGSGGARLRLLRPD
jgi:hypothetical protein